jgi:hypothetical protein
MRSLKTSWRSASTPNTSTSSNRGDLINKTKDVKHIFFVSYNHGSWVGSGKGSW